VDYKILDQVGDYCPDIVGDIHNLPFLDNSQEAIICIAVLEHVENPIKAMEEMYRTLKPGVIALYMFLSCIIITQKVGITEIFGDLRRIRLHTFLSHLQALKYVQ